MPVEVYSPIAFPATAHESVRPHGALTAHLPWMAAVLAAPFCFGAVNSEVQAVLAGFISLSLIFNAAHLRICPGSIAGKIAALSFVALVLISIIKLPILAINALSPETARLAQQFQMPVPSLSLAPGATVVGLWRLLMIFAIVMLAREAAFAHHFTNVFGYALALAVVGLAGTEFWFLADGKGVWNQVKHYPAGTFANRNHFANWMVMGVMLTTGALLRKLHQFQRSECHRRREAVAAVFLTVTVLVGIASVIACGSRGGMLALGTGLGVWILILMRRRMSPMALAMFGLLAVGVVGAFAIWGDLFLHRVSQDSNSFEFKWRIWTDSLAIFRKFLFFGVGLGAFEPAFSIYKTFHGEGSFLFAENEFVQWLVETGILGAACFAAGLLLLLRLVQTPVAQGRFSKIELYHGALAALAAFAVHACFEFVGHVMATGLLAATILGLMIGLKERATGPAVPRLPGRIQMGAALVIGLVIAGLAAPQSIAGMKWRDRKTVSSPMQQEKKGYEAFETWPMESKRAITLVRELMEAANTRQGNSERALSLAGQVLQHALRWHPLDWRLWLEQAWLDLSLSPQKSSASALIAVELNPLQAQIPLRFAASLARLNPPSALEILKRGTYSDPSQIVDALEIAWSIERSPAGLWEIVPASSAGYTALEKFARSKRLERLAEEAASKNGSVPGNNH